MLRNIRKWIDKYWDILSYLFFGVLTTLVNYAVYFPLYNGFSFSAAFSNAAAWCVAVAFAFLTNKPFVFKSKDWSVSVLVPELMKFVGCRIGSGLLETFLLWILVDILAWNGNYVKISVSILVVVLNYISSKWIVFKRRDQR